MTKEQASAVLKHYNLWRRDKNDINQYEMPDPKELGMAIDFAISTLDYKQEPLTDEKYKELVNSSTMWTSSLPVLMYMINKHFGVDTGLKEAWDIKHGIRGED